MRVLLLFLIISTVCAANEFTRVVYLDNYDGDTVRVFIPNVHPVFSVWSVRLQDVDTAEIRGSTKCEREKAIAARLFVKERLSRAKSITLSGVSLGKFTRLRASVIYDGLDLGEQLLGAGLAVKYGVRPNWCLVNKR